MKRVLRSVGVFLVLAFVGGCGTTPFSGDDETVRVLMIGNSFTICCMNHLPAVAAGADVKLDVASLFISKSTLAKHWENAQRGEDGDFTPYEFWRSTLGNASRGSINIPQALKLEPWNVVVIQQSSFDSWRPETYRPCGDELVQLIRRLAPQARVFIQETWSYTPWDARLREWGMSADEMYRRIREANETFAKANGIGIIRTGDAVQMWRKRLPVRYSEKSFGGDVVGGVSMRREEDCFKRGVDGEWMPVVDVCHLNAKGKYFQALVWAAKIFGLKEKDLTYRPQFVSKKDAKLMRKIATELAK